MLKKYLSRLLLVLSAWLALTQAMVLPTSAQSTVTACEADINDDGVVNLIDYSILATEFDPIGPASTPADINSDNRVDLIDLSWLSQFFFDLCVESEADVTVTINPSSTKPISPYIFGTNSLNYTRAKLVRSGGNRWTAYNWETNASNAGTDWQNSSDNYLCSSESGFTCSNSSQAGQAVTGRITVAQNRGAASLITVPIVDFVAADKAGSVTTAASPSNTRWATNQTASSAEGNTPVLGDRAVYQNQFVNFLESTFPNAHTGSNPELFYSLDNEPGLWPSTHPLVHGAKPTYAEMVTRSTTFAQMIKDRQPQAQVFGSVAYGYNEFQTLQDASDRSTTAPGQVGSTYLDFFLASMENSSTTAGRRLLDVLDLHWYPEAKDPVSGCRVTECASDTESKIQARIQAPRSLWDASYRERSWIADDYLQGPVRLIPDIKTRIANNYPGTKLAFTEYYYGGGNHISGALAQADVLGIFAQQEVFAANLWELSPNNQFIYAAFDMYLNYDGAGASVGDLLAASTNSSPATSSVYAMTDSDDPTKTYVVVINKQASAQSFGIAINAAAALNTAEVYELSGNTSTPQQKLALSVANNQLTYTAPGYSVTTLVVKP